MRTKGQPGSEKALFPAFSSDYVRRPTFPFARMQFRSLPKSILKRPSNQVIVNQYLNNPVNPIVMVGGKAKGGSHEYLNNFNPVTGNPPVPPGFCPIGANQSISALTWSITGSDLPGSSFSGSGGTIVSMSSGQGIPPPVGPDDQDRTWIAAESSLLCVESGYQIIFNISVESSWDPAHPADSFTGYQVIENHISGNSEISATSATGSYNIPFVLQGGFYYKFQTYTVAAADKNRPGTQYNHTNLNMTITPGTPP